MEEKFTQLEKERKLLLALCFFGLAIEAAGAVGIFKGARLPGILVALMGLAMWLTGNTLGKKRYARDCGRLRALYGLGLENAELMDKEGEKVFEPFVPRLLPPTVTPAQHLYMFPVRGTMADAETFAAECTLPFQARNQKGRRFLIGTLVVRPLSGQHDNWTVLCGKAYGGVFRREDFSSWHLNASRENVFHCFGPRGSVPSEEQQEALAQFAEKAERGAIVLFAPKQIAVFLPMRFYSGTDSLRSPLKKEDLGKDPLPELGSLPDLEQAFSPQPEAMLSLQPGADPE